MQPRVIAVTGASRGIGAAIALELARRGFVVGCLTRKGAGVESAAVHAELRERMVDLPCDVDDETSLRAAGASTAWSTTPESTAPPGPRRCRPMSSTR